MTRGMAGVLACGIAAVTGVAAAGEGDELLPAIEKRVAASADASVSGARREVAAMIEKTLSECAPAAGEGAAATEPALRRVGGYLGMFIRENPGGGILVERVQPGSGAEAAGFRPGDVVLGSRGRKVPNGDQFIQALWGGRVRSLDVRRAAEQIELPISTKELDAHPAVGEKAPEFELPASDGSSRLRLSALLAKGRPVVLVFGSYT
ncbi:MAG: PDZ domain-containing protein [Planctomycetales bacterium]|nr:PDZ domain-containing protein [Planctomycetales bacterium]